MRRFLACIVIAVAPFAACAACPTDHFQPAMNFGSAFHAGADLAAPSIGERKFLEMDTEEVLIYSEWGRDVYRISLLRRVSDGEGFLSLHQIKDGKTVSMYVSITAREVQEAVAVATPILLNTHYAPQGCEIHFVDGYVAQMAVAAPSGARTGGGLVGGEVFVPSANSEAGRAVALGRKLRNRVLSVNQQ